MQTLLGEKTYFSTELTKLIEKSNNRLRKAFNIRRDLLNIKHSIGGVLTIWEEDTLIRTKEFIRSELKLLKSLKNKSNNNNFINN